MNVLMDAENTRQAYEAIRGGTSVKEISEAWDITPQTIYRALHRHQLPLPEGLSPRDHVQLQIESRTPPDVYAARAGIASRSLRTYASSLGMQLGLRLHSEAKQWWADKLESFEPRLLHNFCVRENLPVHLVATWFHRIHTPEATLLWGFAELRELTNDMFDDVARFANQHAQTHVLGKGRVTARVDIRVASEAYRQSCAYQYKHH